MGAKYLVTANRTEAKIFTVEKGKLSFIKKFENPDGASRNREFQTDRAGSKPGGTEGTHGISGAKDPKSDVELAFTKFLAKNLPLELKEMDDVIIAAEPRFQGFLKTEMKRHSPHTTIRWLSEDWNNLPNAKIEGLLKT